MLANVDLGLTQPEIDVLFALTQGRTVASVTTLAADLWRTTDDWSAIDPTPFVEFVLDELSEKGLVTYREGGSLYPLAHTIRLTRDGWAAAGYPNRAGEVGHWTRHDIPPRHFHDRTEYRSHHSTAEGGPIETQDFATHRWTYPLHVHDYGDTAMTTQDTKIVTAQGKRRPYVKVTPEIEAEVLAAQRDLGVGASYEAIEGVTGIPARSVKYILTDLPRLRGTEAGDEALAVSLKSRVFDLIETLGTVRDVIEIKRLLGTGDDEHSILHVLHSLHTQGRIDFDERGNGMGNATVVNIHLAKRGPKPKPEATTFHPPYDEGAEPEPGNIAQPEAIAAPIPEPGDLPSGYPILHDLAEREWRRAVGDPKANAYLAAATSLEHVDPILAAEMMAKADALAEPFLSPLEAEYVRYATNHPPVKEG